MQRSRLALAIVAAAALHAAPAGAAEICGDGVDNDTDGRADEGCWPAAVTGVCESPLSCQLTGAIAPKSGAVVHGLPPDLEPRVAYGPSIAFQRTYASHYQPGSGVAAYRKPFGKLWFHNWMSWLDKDTAPNPDQAVVHLPSGQEVLFTYGSTASGFDYYTPQAGAHGVDYLRQATASPYKWELRTLDGRVLVYDWSSPTGKLIEMRDALGTPNVVTVSYDGSGRLQYVTDAAGTRRLAFAYNVDDTLNAVNYQTISGATSTTRAYWDFTYASGNVSGARSQGATTQQYTYASGHLSLIEDHAGNDVISFAHMTGTAPTSTARVASSYGELGFEYASSRTGCSGGTVVFFNRKSSTTCDDDSDCGTGLLCGGETDPTSANTGVCYRGARCLQVSSPSEDLVTTVTPLGPPSETCEGACTDVAEYVWDTSSGLNLTGVKDPANNWTSYVYNADGLPTSIVYGDSDGNAANGGGVKFLELYYDDASFPGLVTEVRRKSELSTATCTRSDASGCKRTIYTYTSGGLLSSLQESGFTLNSSNSVTSYSYTTAYAYDTAGRLTQIDGPLSGTNDVVDFTYWSSSDVFKNGRLKEIKRKKDTTNYLVTTLDGHDHWGNATSIQDPDATFTCLAFDPYRNVLTQVREAMNGQTSCTTSHSSDLVTTYTTDAWLRPIETEHPGGGCMIREYDSRGRLSRIKKRDDCNPASAGDDQLFTYDDDGLNVETELLDSSGTVKRRQERTFHDSRRLATLVNPVATTLELVIGYNSRGLVESVEAPSGLGKTELGYDNADRVTLVNRYLTTSTFVGWDIVRDWVGTLESVTDDDSKQIADEHDDMGRKVRTTTPDAGTTLRTYLANGRPASTIEAYGTAGAQTHTHTSDNLGRALTHDYHGNCFTSTPETTVSHDTLPSGITCPSGVGCNHTAGRIAYVRATLVCDYVYADWTLDQETFYSYDAAGRMVREYVRDDTSRTADHQYAWTKDGALVETTTPSGAVLGATFGTTGHNADHGMTSAIWRTSSSTKIADNVTWYPFGGLASYRHQNQISSTNLQTVFSRNLAYRTTNVRVETTSGTLVFQTAITEDDKGRVSGRIFSGARSGVQDSYFLYDQLDRITCESHTSVTSCPSTGIKNHHDGSPPFTASNDWKQFRRPVAGYATIMDHALTLASGTDRISSVSQTCSGCPTGPGTTSYTYDARGNRLTDDNSTYTNDGRSYAYDGRGNMAWMDGQYKVGSLWHTYSVTSMYDAKNRRVFKSHYDHGTLAQNHWFFYYDALDRLVEIRWTPVHLSPSTYTVFQVSWIGDRPVHIWRTDYPGATTSRYYLHTDETSRPLEAYTWPASGSATRLWATNPDAWGNDMCLFGCSEFQPFVHAGQYRDGETVAWQNNGTTPHRPALILNGLRTYDPFLGAYLQTDSRAETTWDSYVYASSNPVGRIDVRGDMDDNGGGGCDHCRFLPDPHHCNNGCSCGFDECSGTGGGADQHAPGGGGYSTEPGESLWGEETGCWEGGWFELGDCQGTEETEEQTLSPTPTPTPAPDCEGLFAVALVECREYDLCMEELQNQIFPLTGTPGSFTDSLTSVGNVGRIIDPCPHWDPDCHNPCGLYSRRCSKAMDAYGRCRVSTP